MPFILCLIALFSDPVPNQHDLFKQWLASTDRQTIQRLPIAQRMLSLAEPLAGRPYIEKTLEVPGPERLVVRLDGFDCFTFVESVLALAHAEESPQPDWKTFTQTLMQIRYRQGQIEDYTSRLHYTCDWAFDNGLKGYLEDVTAAVGGVPYPKTIDFMSSHRKAYAQLADDALYRKIAPIEAAINQRHYHYIPEESLAELEKGIQPGDILAITTNIAGLDISHVGLAKFQNGRLHMMHASSTLKRVVVTQKPMADYLKANKRQTGIMVFRALQASTPVSKQP